MLCVVCSSTICGILNSINLLKQVFDCLVVHFLRNKKKWIWACNSFFFAYVFNA